MVCCCGVLLWCVVVVCVCGSGLLAGRGRGLRWLGPGCTFVYGQRPGYPLGIWFGESHPVDECSAKPESMFAKNIYLKNNNHNNENNKNKSKQISGSTHRPCMHSRPRSLDRETATSTTAARTLIVSCRYRDRWVRECVYGSNSNNDPQTISLSLQTHMHMRTYTCVHTHNT